MATAESLITVACGKCGHESRVIASFAGQAGKCPRCREVVLVPDAATAAAAAVARKAAEAQGAASASEVAAAFAAQVAAGDAPTVAATDLLARVAATAGGTAPTAAAPAVDDDQRPCRACGKPIRKAAIKCRYCSDILDRPCPTCGEQIKATAKKCRFCGEFLDGSLKSRRRQEDLGFTLAEPRARAAAFAVDLSLRLPYYAAFGLWWYCVIERLDVEAVAAGIFGAAYYLILTVVEWSMLARSGQTPGKRWQGIRIVRTDGTPCDFVHGVILRNWIYAVLGNPLFLSILAVVVWVIDGMMIFGDDRRALRDHIASTRVIVVAPTR